MNKVSSGPCPNCNNRANVKLKYVKGKFSVFFCNNCQNGFTHPIPKNLSYYYGTTYWVSDDLLGKIKSLIYHLCQSRRRIWLTHFIGSGNVLDVGSGEGIFGKSLPKSFQVTNLDASFAKLSNHQVINEDFLKWQTKDKFDAIVFWESLEHTDHPQKYIEKAASMLNTGGLIFIEYPRLDCWEARLFGKHWFHLDLPRHLSHLTPKGVDIILSRAKLLSLEHAEVFAAEYIVGGFVGSMLNLLPQRPTDFFKHSKNIPYILLLIPVIVVVFLVEVIFYFFGQSPIYLTIAKKV